MPSLRLLKLFEAFILFSGKTEKHTANNTEKGTEKGSYKYSMRPLCKSCQAKPCAINYYKDKRVFYRKYCESCARNGGKVKGIPRWYQLGYRQKDHCEKCGFKSKNKEVFNVFHIDGDLTNCRPTNLKTVCANCQRALHKEGARWRQGDLTPDF